MKTKLKNHSIKKILKMKWKKHVVNLFNRTNRNRRPNNSVMSINKENNSS